MATTLDPGFGHWLAGLIDGEGSFFIRRSRRTLKSLEVRSCFDCVFALKLRDDDSPTLQVMGETLGFGRFYHYAHRKGVSPMSEWKCSNKVDCLSLIEVIDEYPLRTKKALDYQLWRQAVMDWTETGQKKLASHYTVLRESRKYVVPDTPSLRTIRYSENGVLAGEARG